MTNQQTIIIQISSSLQLCDTYFRVFQFLVLVLGPVPLLFSLTALISPVSKQQQQAAVFNAKSSDTATNNIHTKLASSW